MNKEKIVESVTNQMMKSGSAKKLRATSNQRLDFKAMYEEEIIEAMRLMPQRPASMIAVIAKALAKHDREKVVKFCDDFCNKNFSGPNDPVFLFWRFLKRADKNPSNLYPSVVYALRNYLEDKKVREIRPSSRDI
jgi:hypothetical protein